MMIYFVIERDIDNDGHEVWTHVGDSYFASKTSAQEYCDKLIAVRQAVWQKNREIAKGVYDKQKAEHDALYAAGLRSTEMREFKFREFVNDYRVDEAEVLP